MDSWLYDNVEDGLDDPESDPEETKAELEERLYSIIHHNDLSQPLPPELAKHYSISCTDSGEVEVVLKDSLAELKSEECEKIDQVLTNPEFKTEKEVKPSIIDIVDDDDVVIVSEDNKIPETKNPKKRFRYSDINLDSTLESKNNIKPEFIPSILDHLGNMIQTALNHNNGQFSKLNMPSFDFLTSYWKTNVNDSFISFGTNRMDRKTFEKKMVHALSEVNPGVKFTTLRSFANVLYNRLIRAEKRKRHRHNKSNRLLETWVNRPPVNTPTPNKKNTSARMNGSVSLNITPFRPDTPTVDLTSDGKALVPTNSRTSWPEKKMLNSSIPDKWSPSMIKYYTTIPKIKMETDIGTVLDHLKKTTKKSDWLMDMQDLSGKYKSPQSQGKKRRCNICNRPGHLPRACPRAKKIICSFCGCSSHDFHSCPDKVCMKCGVYLKNLESFNEECITCYYSHFTNLVSCEVCGKMTHLSSFCPDLWRSFHATTEGEKKIPPYIMQNPRKYCCNCARKGHFSHECTEPMNSNEQISPFVSNYSAIPSQKGTSEVAIPRNYWYIFESHETDLFLQTLSNKINVQIMCETDSNGYILKICGTFHQCQRVKSEIEDYVNVKKRKRIEPPLPIIKRQRIK